MEDNVASMVHTITVRVTDSKTYISSRMGTVVSTTTVRIDVQELAEQAPYNTGSIRLSGRCPFPIVSHSLVALSDYSWFILVFLSQYDLICCVNATLNPNITIIIFQSCEWFSGF